MMSLSMNAKGAIMAKSKPLMRLLHQTHCSFSRRIGFEKALQFLKFTPMVGGPLQPLIDALNNGITYIDFPRVEPHIMSRITNFDSELFGLLSITPTMTDEDICHSNILP
jgi:hypothetical protein